MLGGWRSDFNSILEGGLPIFDFAGALTRTEPLSLVRTFFEILLWKSLRISLFFMLCLIFFFFNTSKEQFFFATLACWVVR